MEVVTDGRVEIDGGTADEIRQELSQETVTPAGKGTAVAEKPQTEAEKAAAASGANGDARPKKKQTFQDRINEKTAETYAEKRARLAVEQERDALKARIEALERGEKPKPATERRESAATVPEFGGVPLTAEKFPTFAEMLKTNPDLELEDYTDQRQDWRTAKAETAKSETQAVAHASEEFTKTAATFGERMSKVLETNPKFYKSIDPLLTETPARSALPPGSKGRNAFGPFIVEQIIRSEFPNELMSWLSADGSKELQRLETLNPVQVVREIFKKELSIHPADAVTGSSAAEQDFVDGDADDESDEPAAAVAVVTQSKAAPPVRPVRGSSQQASESLDATDDDSDDQWLAKEQARELKKLKSRRTA